jgi:hypothetical protein
LSKTGLCMRISAYPPVENGGYVDIEVSYKILHLDVLKETPILHDLSCFE